MLLICRRFILAHLPAKYRPKGIWPRIFSCFPHQWSNLLTAFRQPSRYWGTNQPSLHWFAFLYAKRRRTEILDNELVTQWRFYVSLSLMVRFRDEFQPAVICIRTPMCPFASKSNHNNLPSKSPLNWIELLMLHTWAQTMSEYNAFICRSIDRNLTGSFPELCV